MQNASAIRFVRSCGVALLAVLGLSEAASAVEVVHSCIGSVADGYGKPVSGGRVRFWLAKPDVPAIVLAGPREGVTDELGRAAVTLPYDRDTAVALHCTILQDGLPHKIKTIENVVGHYPPAPFGGQITVTAEMAPNWVTGPGATPSFPGAREDSPDHGRGHARLYLSEDGEYDKVVVIPQGMDFAERTPGRQTADDLWFTFSAYLKALHSRGYDVWLFRPHLTGQNIHEQAAEFAQAIRHAADYGPGPQDGKVIVAGYSLGALVARIATARWEAEEAWRMSLGLVSTAPPVHLVAFMDGALRGANVNRKLQDKLWENGAQRKTNLASCAAGQLIRNSKMCAGSACFDKFFSTGQRFVFYDGDGTCDVHDPYGPGLNEPCVCDAGPAVSTLNGDGFPHTMETIAFSVGTWNPPMNLCHGGDRDRNSKGQDVCPSDPGGNGPYAPAVGDTWWTVKCRSVLGSVLHSEHFEASAADLAPGGRFAMAFGEDRQMLDFLPDHWECDRLESIQDFAFTFIPIDSALAGDSPEQSPFPPDRRKTGTYQGVHDRPQPELFDWLFAKFEAAYGSTGGGGGGSVPTTPGNVVASPVVGGWDQIDLTWEDRSDNEDHFVIQRLLGGDTAWQTIRTVPEGTTSFRDTPATGLRVPTQAEGTLFYFYRVFATNDHGSSGESNRADTRLYNQPPGISDTLRPRGCIEDLLPTLSWRGGERSTSYYVRLLDVELGEEAMPDVEVTTTHVPTSVALTPRKPYMLRIWGQNNVGWGTGSSPEFFRTFCEPVDPPEFLEPVGCIEDLTPVLKWTPVTGALSYHVRVFKVQDLEEVAPVFEGGPLGTSIEIPATQALEPGKDYRVWVKPHTAGSTDPYSRIRFFTTMCGQATGAGYVSPIAPGQATTNQPEFLFEEASRADSYRLEVHANATGTQIAYTRDYAAAAICANGLCSVRPDVSLSVGVHAWRVYAGRGFVFDPVAMWAKATIPALPSVSVGPAAAAEASGALSFPITLSSPATLPVTLSIRTEDGTALQGADYLALAGSWTIPAGASALAVTVPLVDDAVNETTETLRLRLSEVSGALVGAAVGTGTISDDDPLPQFVPGSFLQPEAGLDWAVPIGLLGQSDRDVTATYSVEACTADEGVDFVTSVGEIKFSPGETVKHIPITVLDDGQSEGHEIVRVTLSDPQGGVITENWAQATLANDDPPSRGRSRSDFNGDGNNDIVWREPSGGLRLWRMVGVNRVGAATFNPAAPANGNWNLAASADFNADASPDLVWRNEDSGRLAFWFMAGVNRQSSQLVDGIGDLAWKLVGTGQFDANRSIDLVWRNATTGELKIWFMDGAQRTGEAAPTPTQPADPNWTFQGVGDFDGNGRRDDLLWRNTISGRLVVWLMDGLVRRDARSLTPDNGLDWRLVALMDVDADGTADVVWQRDNPSRLGAWLLRGTTLTCPMFLTPREPDAPGGSVIAPR